MTLTEFLLATGFIAGALLIAWGYTLTDRGRSAPRDIEKANRRSRWWMRKAVLAQHWPLLVLIVGYTLAFGVIAAQY